MVLRGGKEVDKKVSDKKYDHEERPKTNETNCEIQSDSSPAYRRSPQFQGVATTSRRLGDGLLHF